VKPIEPAMMRLDALSLVGSKSRRFEQRGQEWWGVDGGRRAGVPLLLDSAERMTRCDRVVYLASARGLLASRWEA